MDAGARGLRRIGVTPNQLTLAGLVLGGAAAVFAGMAEWTTAGVLWLVGRVPDGLDGALARLEGPGHDRDLGGYLDIVADFAVYGGFVVGCGVGAPDARVACLALLLAYYVNGTAFFGLSSIAERRGVDLDDASRTYRFDGGLAEGTETIVTHAAMAFLPDLLGWIAAGFAVVVVITAGQRVVAATRILRHVNDARDAAGPAPDG